MYGKHGLPFTCFAPALSHLPHSLLAKAHRFLLELHAGGDAAGLRSLVPAGVAGLVGCDRAAFNEFRFGERLEISPWPKPSYWDRFGEFMSRHVRDHALFDETQPIPLHRAVTFADRRSDARWESSPLRHDYYGPVGVREQLALGCLSEGPVWLGLNANRTRARDFSATDRAVLELVSPHVACAWRNIVALTALRQPASAQPPAVAALHLLTVDSAGRLLTEPPAGTRDLVRRFCRFEAGGGRALPEPLAAWLRAQRLHLATAEAVGAPPASLALPGPQGTLIARLAQAGLEAAVVLLEERRAEPPPAARSGLPRFTHREGEILQWIAEGKRDREIAVIVGCAPKTVGKHVEHILEKLGVETRTAAARVVLDRERAGN